MATITKDFLIVPPNEVYPVQLRTGDECPDWALAVAKEIGAISATRKAPKNKMMMPKLETK